MGLSSLKLDYVDMILIIYTLKRENKKALASEGFKVTNFHTPRL